MDWLVAGLRRANQMAFQFFRKKKGAGAFPLAEAEARVTAAIGDIDPGYREADGWQWGWEAGVASPPLPAPAGAPPRPAGLTAIHRELHGWELRQGNVTIVRLIDALTQALAQHPGLLQAGQPPNAEAVFIVGDSEYLRRTSTSSAMAAISDAVIPR